MKIGYIEPFDDIIQNELLTPSPDVDLGTPLFNNQIETIIPESGTDQLPDITDPAPTETPPPVNYGKLILIGAGVWIVFKIIQGK